MHVEGVGCPIICTCSVSFHSLSNKAYRLIDEFSLRSILREYERVSVEQAIVKKDTCVRSYAALTTMQTIFVGHPGALINVFENQA